jgi:hypothetical protein
MKQTTNKWIGRAIVVITTAAILFLGQGAVKTILVLEALLGPLREAQ